MFYTVNILWLLHVVNHVITWLWHFVSFNPRYIYIFGRRLSCRGVTLRRVSEGTRGEKGRLFILHSLLWIFSHLTFVFSSASKQNTVVRQDTFLQDTQLYSHISANAAPYHTMYIHDVLTSHKLSFRSLILCTLESFFFFVLSPFFSYFDRSIRMDSVCDRNGFRAVHTSDSRAGVHSRCVFADQNSGPLLSKENRFRSRGLEISRNASTNVRLTEPRVRSPFSILFSSCSACKKTRERLQRVFPGAGEKYGTMGGLSHSAAPLYHSHWSLPAAADI